MTGMYVVIYGRGYKLESFNDADWETITLGFRLGPCL